jgi:hypothetical protein
MLRIARPIAFTCVLLAGCGRSERMPAAEVHGSSPAISGDEYPARTITWEQAPPPRAVPTRSAREALEAGAAFLLRQQSPDGAWRSDLYATFKDGLALTPLVVLALQDAASVGVEPAGCAQSRRKGIEFLARTVRPDGSIDPGKDGVDYPVYTAALTILVLTHADGKEFRPVQQAWVKYLKERQLTSKLGWNEDEKQYGGWGYCRVIPEKPKPGEFAPNLIESNLSATVFALEALQAVGQLDAESKKAAANFVWRCQNVNRRGEPGITKFDDGGFHFIYDDPVRNKAGKLSEEDFSVPLPIDQTRPVFFSYGSATADGLRALSLCGGESRYNELALKWAASWLGENFRADIHPGKYSKAMESNRNAVYYYYAASVSKTMREQNILLRSGDWAKALARELAIRQHRDGSWSNPVELVRENEPLVATSNAVSALSRCLK